MSKKDEKELPQDKFMAKRLRESRKREAEYEASLDPRQRAGSGPSGAVQPVYKTHA